MQEFLETAGISLLRAPTAEEWLFFASPTAVLVANRRDEVLPVLEEVERATEQGRYAVGFLTYEAAGAFDSAQVTRTPSGGPLVWFGVYVEPRLMRLPDLAGVTVDGMPSWTPEVTWQEYRDAVQRIHDYIAAGETYQVNYTFRLRSRISVPPMSFFLQLWRAQQPRYGAWLSTGDAVICSASPELFFALEGDRIQCRPMKGTRRRGRTLAEDVARYAELKNSEKDRAENLMIVDMMRNDVGRIARPGSVRVNSLFDVERLPTLWQMTSSVQASTVAPISEIFRALFPCASVTGAPKVRTMQIIAELEKSPRGVYTGAIGYVMPRRRACFSVAIRTACVRKGEATYGVGGGVVWDSSPEREYEEALAKAEILNTRTRTFSLLETLRWEPQAGFLYLERHLQRLAKSAQYFGYALDLDGVQLILEKTAQSWDDIPQRVRLLCDKDGRAYVESSALDVPFADRPEAAKEIRAVAFARAPVSSSDVFLYHKTTSREVYESARLGAASVDDVLLWNERGEVTESSVANLVVVYGHEWLTPFWGCGLLNGVYRALLLETGRLREAVLTREDVQQADALYLINSVRGWTRCRLVAALE